MLTGTCAFCKSLYEADEKLAGRKVVCPHCGKTINVAKPVKPPKVPVQKQKVYRNSIIATMLEVFGALNFCAGFFVLVGMLTSKSGWGAMLGLPVLASFLIASFFCFGLAQIIGYLAKTAYYTERIYDSIQHEKH